MDGAWGGMRVRMERRRLDKELTFTKALEDGVGVC